jgi:hypothetical protein
MNYLRNRLEDTDILRKNILFLKSKMPEFVPGLKEVVEKSGANLLNVTIRVVHADAVRVPCRTPIGHVCLWVVFQSRIE